MKEKLKKYSQLKKERSLYYLISCLAAAFFLNLFIETLARQAVPGLGGLIYMVTKPLIFCENWLIIFATLSVSILIPWRAFVKGFIASIWIAMGIANGVILTQRMTPFTMKDLSSFGDGATIITNYMSTGQIVLVVGGLTAAVLLYIFLIVKGGRTKATTKFFKRLICVAGIMVITLGATWGLIRVNVLSTFFGNLAYAYQDYGVPYCFINTWLNTGIHRSNDYSESYVKALFDKDDYSAKDGTMKPVKSDEGTKEESPNVLFLQLESFVDPALFNNIKTDKDAIPNFRKLYGEYSSGSLTVPACGAGTANTEFEVMTGLSVKFFGPGEYPFKSVLKEKTAESAAQDFKYMGYGTHAIHNHRAMFYNRHIVFDNIGYDTFTSLEYMSDVEKTPKGWAKDKILTSQILETMKSTKARDYIYTISVQGHGKYPEEPTLSNPEIKVTDAPSEEMKNKYEYFVNEMKEMDDFVGDLTEAIEKFDEPCVLVMYGDHIPALDVKEESYDAKDLYQTQYIIFSNFDMKKKDRDLATYQLTAEVLDRLDIHKGTIFKYHQTRSPRSKGYLKNLKMLGYDMLYGENYIYGGTNPWKKAGMKMGVKKIRIDKVVNVAGKYYIKGENFTEFSKVTLDGEPLSTVYLGPSLLGLLTEVDPNDASKMKVSQIDRTNNSIISTTE